MKKVHIIDALPYVYRAYYALPSGLKDPHGRHSNAVIGFANFLVKYIKREEPTHLAICWDSCTSTNFRRDSFPAYKSNREPASAELRCQIERCRLFSEALGLTCYNGEGYEADDLIATLARPLVDDGHSCTVVTNDKDLCQLVGPRLEFYDFAKARRYDEQGVLKKLGVRPAQVPDFLGLAGDSVDCIPGVPRLGPKTAVFLLAHFNDLEELYEKLDQVSKLKIRGAQGIADRLGANKELAFQSRKLATVSYDAPLEGGGAIDTLQCQPPAPLQTLTDLSIDFGLPDGRFAFEEVCGGSVYQHLQSQPTRPKQEPEPVVSAKRELEAFVPVKRMLEPSQRYTHGVSLDGIAPLLHNEQVFQQARCSSSLAESPSK